MGLWIFPGLTMLFALLQLLWLPHIGAQPTGEARPLDSILQDYAYRAFIRPRTGKEYNGVPPSNLTGISISAMRLRSGSLRTRGVPMYKEFEIPTGVIVTPYVERLVLVYQNLGNWSSVYYPLPGYTYLAPVLGLLAYDASNLSAKNLPELDIRASNKSILIKFQNVESVPGGSDVKCVWFDLHGLVNFSNASSGNVCSTVQHGHFAVVVESSEFPPPPSAGGKGSNSKVWIIVGSVVGGLALLVFLVFLVFWVRKYKQKKRMKQMENAAEVGETLHMANVGSTKAPVARVTRTQPVLENEYVP